MKANPKIKADPKADAAPVAASGKGKLFIMIGAAVLVLALGGGAGWYFMHKGADDSAPAEPAKKEHTSSKKAKKSEAKPEYIAVEPFTVNLQPEHGDQYLQVAFTLQVDSPEQVELIKANMAKVRSRVLLLLSGKKASEISTAGRTPSPGVDSSSSASERSRKPKSSSTCSRRDSRMGRNDPTRLRPRSAIAAAAPAPSPSPK